MLTLAKRVGAVLAALALLVAGVVVPATTHLGPVLVDAGGGIGLHAGDVPVAVAALVGAAALLRWAELAGD